MSEVEQLEQENFQLRADYDRLVRVVAELGIDLQSTEQRLADLETERLAPAVGGDEEHVYYASKNRNKFHRPSCKFANCLLGSRNLIEFSSHREAREAGYKPCGQCKA